MLPKPTKASRAPKPLRRNSGRIKTRRPAGTKRREAKAAGYVDPFMWVEVVRFYGGLCAYCETRHWHQQDHVRPISKGGAHHIGNLVPSCEPCNLKKGQSTRWKPRREHPFMGGGKCCEGCC